MAHFIPKKLTSKNAQKYADLHLVKEDLQHVISCCDALTMPVSFAEFFKMDALVDSAFIRYRRCFKGGVRTLLTTLVDQLSEEERAQHQFLLDYCDKHTAHSVNNYEEIFAAVWVDVNTSDPMLRSGVGCSGSRTKEVELTRLRSFAMRFHHLAEVWSEELKAGLEKEVAAMSDDRIRALPDALGPPPKLVVHRARA